MNALYITALALLGAAFGSFANVVIYRLPKSESLSSPPSRCPACGHPIRWHDNIPILSWILLRGRCRDCKQPISIRYPLVEAASVAIWILAGALFGWSIRAGTAIAFFYILLILAFIDIDTGRLPNPIVGLLAGIGVLGVGLSAVLSAPVAPLTYTGEGGISGPILAAALGVVLGGGISLALALAYEAVRKRQGFGMGDVKLLAAMGPYLGAYVLLAFFAGSIMHILAFALSRVVGHPVSSKAPFGPSLAVGGVLAATLGPGIVGWYLGALVVTQ